MQVQVPSGVPEGVPNFPETQVYVQRVLKLYRHYLNQAVFDWAILELMILGFYG